MVRRVKKKRVAIVLTPTQFAKISKVAKRKSRKTRKRRRSTRKTSPCYYF